MDAVDFLNSDTVDLPKTRIGAYTDFVDHLLDEYQNQINRVVKRRFIDRAISNELKRVVPLSNAVREVVKMVIGGDRTSAYNRLDTALHELGPHLRALMPSGDMSQFVNPMYRFRPAGQSTFYKGDLFHISFDLRHIVKPMRYSVAGLPSLYLGGSTHVCWRELGERNLATIAVSRFEAVANTNLKVLNFGHRLPVLASYVAKVPGDFNGPTPAAAMIAANVACWPLIAACSVRVPDAKATERPEYLVPQLMLEWITRTHQFHGIRYFSTHYSEYPDDPKTYMNYVFPAKSNSAIGYCSELCQLFKMTDPVSWSVAKNAPIANVKRPKYKTREVLDMALESEFGRAEDGLLGMSVDWLPSCPDEHLLALRSRVQMQAYKLWEDEGHPHGRDQEHWFQAKADLGIPMDLLI